MNSKHRSTRLSGGRGLVFDWPHPAHLHLAFPLFLMLAALIHAAAVFSLGIRYPAGRPPAVHAAEVFLTGERGSLSPGLPVWLRAEDPSLLAPGREDSGLPPIEAPSSHTPSFDLVAPDFMQAPSGTTSARFGSALAEMSRPVPTTVSKSAAAVAPLPVIGIVETARSAGNDPQVDSAPIESPEARPSVFLARITDDGTVREVFTVRTSGNPRADAERAARIRRARGTAGAGERMVWIEMSSEPQTAAGSPIAP